MYRFGSYEPCMEEHLLSISSATACDPAPQKEGKKERNAGDEGPTWTKYHRTH